MLNSLITSKTRLKLLIKFFISQANIGHLNGLASEMGESTNSIRKELNHLFDAGYLEKHKQNNKVIYNVNSNHPLIGKILKEKNANKQKDIAKQAADLALLSQNMLKGEELTKFISRSLELI